MIRWMVVVATVVAGLIIAIGVMGTVLPILPGILLSFSGVFLYGVLTGWDALAITVTGVAAVVAVAGVVLGVRIPARTTGAVAGRNSLRAGMIGGVIGFFAIPVIGLVLGWLAGVFVSEARATDARAARKATYAVIRSFGVTVIVQFGLAMTMALLWGVWAVFELFA